MVAAVRNGGSIHQVARQFHVARSLVRRWVARAKGPRLDRVDWSSRFPGRRRPEQDTCQRGRARVARASWPKAQITAKITVQALLEHWRRHGLPMYAQFDNDTIFQGAHHYRDTLGRVIRLCLSLSVIPVFAPPRETGFQAAIEAFSI